MSVKSFLLAAVCFGLSVLAKSQDFEVAPVLMSFNANPGEIQSQKITVRNHSNFRQKFVFNLSDYDIDEKGTKKSLPLGTSKNSCAEWITVNPSFVELNPNESFEVNVNMVVPADGYSTRWCMVQVQTAKEQEGFEADRDLATGVVIVPRIVVLIKQSPRSNKNYRAKVTGIEELKTAKSSFKSFKVTVQNTGDKIIEGKVYLAVANIETGEEQKFNPESVTVYPGYARSMELSLPVKLSPGKYALAALLDYGNRMPIEGTQLLLDIK
ncbi:MAG: hypothetical protein JXB34_05330 [Bacteroidales bacterium]|nr:hypothetical protein [Bacteroidales bacterium]